MPSRLPAACMPCPAAPLPYPLLPTCCAELRCVLCRENCAVCCRLPAAAGKVAIDYSVPHVTLKSSATLTAAPKVCGAGCLDAWWASGGGWVCEGGSGSGCVCVFRCSASRHTLRSSRGLVWTWGGGEGTHTRLHHAHCTPYLGQRASSSRALPAPPPAPHPPGGRGGKHRRRGRGAGRRGLVRHQQGGADQMGAGPGLHRVRLPGSVAAERPEQRWGRGGGRGCRAGACSGERRSRQCVRAVVQAGRHSAKPAPHHIAAGTDLPPACLVPPVPPRTAQPPRCCRTRSPPTPPLAPR